MASAAQRSKTTSAASTRKSQKRSATVSRRERVWNAKCSHGRAERPDALHQDRSGAIASLGETIVRCRRYLVGTPAIAARVVRIDPRGSFYIPFRVSLYQRISGAGAVLAFDRPSSLLGVLGQAGFRVIGLQLDDKIDAVTQRAAGASGRNGHSSLSRRAC